MCACIDAVDSPQPRPREIGHLCREQVGVELEVLVDPVPARALGQTDEAIRQVAAMRGLDVGVDQGRDRLGDGVLDRSHCSRELFVSPGTASEQQDERRALFSDEVEVGLEAALDLLVRRSRLGGGLADRGHQPIADVAEQLEVEASLRGEVLVQHGLGDPGCGCDVVHRGGVEALRGEHVERDDEQLVPTFGGRESARHGYRRVTEGDQKPCARSSFSAALTAYPSTIDGARKIDPMTMLPMTMPTIAPLNSVSAPTTNATTAITNPR